METTLPLVDTRTKIYLVLTSTTISASPMMKRIQRLLHLGVPIKSLLKPTPVHHCNMAEGFKGHSNPLHREAEASWTADETNSSLVTVRNLLSILQIVTKFGVQLQFSERFGTKLNSVWYLTYRKIVIAIQIWFRLSKFSNRWKLTCRFCVQVNFTGICLYIRWINSTGVNHIM